MRNLKRVLSLAMAAAMLIGMMVVSAGAVSTYEDFTDKDEIQNTEAVNTMVSLGVINGKDDGSYFDPNGIVTRAEMAALIARCLNGGIDPSLGTGASTTAFSDTKGHWAEAYIAYCANLGIINGKGDGTFGPDEQVTGTAAAKMFLCALGYRSDIEKLTGPGWDLNTDSKANEVGLYANLGGLTPSSGLNRDNTAQLIYNGVQANMVVYRNNYGEYSGVINSQPVNGTDVNSEPSTMLYVRFGVNKVVGVVEGNEFFTLDGAPQREGRTRIRLTESGAYGNAGALRTFNVSTDAGLIGQKVVLYVRPTSKLSPNPEADTVLGDAIVANSNVVVTTMDRYTSYTTTTFKKFLSNNGLTDGGASYQNYMTTKPNTTAGQPDVAVGDIAQNLRGVELTVIDYDDNGVVDYKLAIYRSLARVSVYNTSKNEITLSNGEKFDFDDVIGVEDVAANDYVLYFVANGKMYVEKAEPVTATMDSFVARSNVTLDGTTYNMSALGGAQSGAHMDKISDLTRFNNAGNTGAHPMTTELGVTFNGSTSGDSGDLELNDTYDLYLDKAGNIIAWEVSDASVGSYALVLETVLNSNSMNSSPEGRVSLLLADGTRVSGALDIEATQSNYKRADNTMTTARTFADRYVAKTMDLFDANGDAGTDGIGDTSMLAGTIVTYSANSNGTYVLRPTNWLRTSNQSVGTLGTASTWNHYSTTGVVNGTATTTNTSVVKGMTAITTQAGDTKTFIVNENTVFVFGTGDFDTETVSVVTGASKLSSTPILNSIKAVAYNERTNVARMVYVNADSGTSTSNYMYVEKNPTTRSVDGVRRVIYKAVNKDGEFVELITNELTNLPSGIYKVVINGEGIASLTAAPAIAVTSGYLGDDTVANSIVYNTPEGRVFNSVHGRIEAMEGSVITVEYWESGVKYTYSLNVNGVNNQGVYVDDASNPATGVSLTVGQQVMISFKKDNKAPAVETVYITDLFADKVLPPAGAPPVNVAGAGTNGATLASTALDKDDPVDANVYGYVVDTNDMINFAISPASNSTITSASLTLGGTPVAGFDKDHTAVKLAGTGAQAYVLTVKAVGDGANTSVAEQTYTYALNLTVAAGPQPTYDLTVPADVSDVTVNGDPATLNANVVSDLNPGDAVVINGLTNDVHYYVDGLASGNEITVADTKISFTMPADDVTVERMVEIEWDSTSLSDYTATPKWAKSGEAATLEVTPTADASNHRRLTFGANLTVGGESTVVTEKTSTTKFTVELAAAAVTGGTVTVTATKANVFKVTMSPVVSSAVTTELGGVVIGATIPADTYVASGASEVEVTITATAEGGAQTTSAIKAKIEGTGGSVTVGTKGGVTNDLTTAAAQIIDASATSLDSDKDTTTLALSNVDADVTLTFTLSK